MCEMRVGGVGPSQQDCVRVNEMTRQSASAAPGTEQLPTDEQLGECASRFRTCRDVTWERMS